MMFSVSFGMLALSTILMIIAGVFGLDIKSLPVFCVAQVLTQVLSFVAPVVFIVWLYHRDEPREFLRADFAASKWRLSLAGIAAWVLLTPLMDWTVVWNDNIHFGEALAPLEELLRRIGEESQALLDQILMGASVVHLVVSLLVVAIIPAVCEEVFFRAGMQNLMLRWVKNPHVAVWVTAAVFSLFHGEVFAFLPRFLMGAVLGYLYLGSNSIVPNMVAHFFNNAVAVVLTWLILRGVVDMDPEAPLALAWPVTLGCTVAAIAVMYVSFGKNLKISR